MRPTLTIDLDAVAWNWRALDALSDAETAAVVKADAYGLGVERVAPALWSAGARVFFVATGPEAETLRAVLDAQGAAARDAVVYVLNGPIEPVAFGPTIRPVLSSMADVERLRELAPSGDVSCALQLETGMNRLGLTMGEQAEILVQAAAPADRLAPFPPVALVMSHFAAADEPGSDLTTRQAAAFAEQRDRFRRAFPDARFSLSATGGGVMDPELHLDLIRPGVGVVGGLPFAGARPVVRLEAPILRVWDVAPGERSGYGGTWTAARPSRLATIPVGYADGFPRTLSNRGEAIVGGRIVPFAGRVSMDLIVLDVTEAGPVAPGDRATLLDETLTVDRVAERAGTIGYEILTSLGRRYDRRYEGCP